MGDFQLFLKSVKLKLRALGLTEENIDCILFRVSRSENRIYYRYQPCFPDKPPLKEAANNIIGNTAIETGFDGTTHNYDPEEYRD